MFLLVVGFMLLGPRQPAFTHLAHWNPTSCQTNIHNEIARIWDSRIESSKIEIMETDRRGPGGQLLLTATPGSAARRRSRRPCVRRPAVCGLYYTILYYTILYYSILWYTTIYHTILYILYYAIQYCTILYHTILQYTILCYAIQYCIIPSHKNACLFDKKHK